MSDIAIQVENLSKQYRIGVLRHRHDTLRDQLMDAATSLFRRNRKAKAHEGVLWALKDVSFEIKQGEVVGIVGRNGAGKSTLLKILSRITEPTSGRAKVYSRVASLLEVGTGFHPELTGRENIYLNGAVLGMKKAEINSKFDEIVTFAEIEKFIDTPVKRYSSGMYLRLAFAVAAHLEPEILIVDEVLAVGDVVFQKKCLGKMGDVAKEGRTVILVSHNMAAIESLCGRCLLFDRGQLEAVGEQSEVISKYISSNFQRDCGVKDLSFHPGRTRDSVPIMKTVVLSSRLGQATCSLFMGAPLAVQVSFQCEARALRPVLGVIIKSAYGASIFGVNNKFIGGYEFREAVSRGNITCHFETLPLVPGIYFLDLYFGDQHQDLDIIHEAESFSVLPADVFGTGKLPPPTAGPVYWPATWTLSGANPDTEVQAHRPGPSS